MKVYLTLEFIEDMRGNTEVIVTRTGVEPVIFGMKARRPGPLDERASHNTYCTKLKRFCQPIGLFELFTDTIEDIMCEFLASETESNSSSKSNHSHKSCEENADQVLCHTELIEHDK